MRSHFDNFQIDSRIRRQRVDTNYSHCLAIISAGRWGDDWPRNHTVLVFFGPTCHRIRYTKRRIDGENCMKRKSEANLCDKYWSRLDAFERRQRYYCWKWPVEVVIKIDHTLTPVAVKTVAAAAVAAAAATSDRRLASFYCGVESTIGSRAVGWDECRRNKDGKMRRRIKYRSRATRATFQAYGVDREQTVHVVRRSYLFVPLPFSHRKWKVHQMQSNIKMNCWLVLFVFGVFIFFFIFLLSLARSILNWPLTLQCELQSLFSRAHSSFIYKMNKLLPCNLLVICINKCANKATLNAADDGRQIFRSLKRERARIFLLWPLSLFSLSVCSLAALFAFYFIIFPYRFNGT